MGVVGHPLVGRGRSQSCLCLRGLLVCRGDVLGGPTCLTPLLLPGHVRSQHPTHPMCGRTTSPSGR